MPQSTVGLGTANLGLDKSRLTLADPLSVVIVNSGGTNACDSTV